MDNHFIGNLRDILDNCISETASARNLFLLSPGKDYSRKRKISFQDAIKCVLEFAAKSTPNEVHDYFGHSSSAPSASALIQQRDKILPEAFRFLLHLFLEETQPLCKKTYTGYYMIACDGSDANLFRNPDDPETFIREGDKGYNQIHLNAFYDLLNHDYTDVEFQGKKKLHERLAFCTMLSRYPCDRKTIFIADRGYESFNTFAHVIEKGQSFVIRIKDPKSNGILAAYDLPDGCFDNDIITTLTRRHTKETLGNPDTYTILSPRTDFDFLPDQYTTYHIEFRILGFEVSPGKYEYVATNLSRKEFPPDKVREIYMMRWGEENSFRELKHTIGLSHLHSKKKNLVEQEFLARIVIYNFCEIVATHAVVDNDKGRKWKYRINFATATNICRTYLRDGGDDEDVMKAIQRHITPIREGRSYHRDLRPQRFNDFMYRIA